LAERGAILGTYFIYLHTTQTYFFDATTYYENALPRMLAFVDPTTPAGFKTFNDPTRYYGGATSLPSWMINSRGGTFFLSLAGGGWAVLK
jgi:hypothetical protein